MLRSACLSQCNQPELPRFGGVKRRGGGQPAKAGLDRLWQAGAKPVLSWFDATQPGTPAAAAVLKRERGYFSTNAQRMQSPALPQQDLPIGSGAVEATPKHLVQQRMKRAGSRRSDLGARAILDLRCHLLSGRSLDCVA